MLTSFFHLNGRSNTPLTQNQLLQRLVAQTVVENADFVDPVFAPTRPANLIGNKTFRNVRFKSTRIVGVEFRYCTFEDCLFLGAVIDTCEFHHTKFVGCNPYKTRFINTYIDPQIFEGLLSPKDHANIGVFLFQQLRFNALATYQPDFADSADWLFRRWQRYELNYKYSHAQKYKDLEEPISGWRYWCKRLASCLYELTSGFGHSFFRFVITSVLLFALVVGLNHWFWRDFETNSQLKANHPWLSSLYYTAITLTTLGYGDITPRTIWTMMLAAVEAVGGFFWFALLASMLVRRVLR